jgi:hypothetical protein
MSKKIASVVGMCGGTATSRANFLSHHVPTSLVEWVLGFACGATWMTLYDTARRERATVCAYVAHIRRFVADEPSLEDSRRESYNGVDYGAFGTYGVKVMRNGLWLVATYARRLRYLWVRADRYQRPAIASRLAATIIRNNASSVQWARECETGEELRQLAKCERLRTVKLNVSDSELERENTAILAACTRLSNIRISASYTYDATHFLRLLQTTVVRPRRLSIRVHHSVSNQGVAFDSALSKVQRLVLHAPWRSLFDATLCLRQLTYLSLDTCGLSEIIRILRLHPRLVSMRISNFVRSDDTGTTVGTLTFALRKLTIKGTPGICKLLAQCPVLEVAHLSYTSKNSPSEVVAAEFLRTLAASCPFLVTCSISNHSTRSLRDGVTSAMEPLAFPKLQDLTLHNCCLATEVENLRMPSLRRLTLYDVTVDERHDKGWELSTLFVTSPLLERLWVSATSMPVMTCRPATHDDCLLARLVELNLFSSAPERRHPPKAEQTMIAAGPTPIRPVTPSLRRLLEGVLSWCTGIERLLMHRDRMRFADLEALAALPSMHTLRSLYCDADADHADEEDLDDDATRQNLETRIVRPFVRVLERCPALTLVVAPSNVYMDVDCRLLYPFLRLRPFLNVRFFGRTVGLPEPSTHGVQ